MLHVIITEGPSCAEEVGCRVWLDSSLMCMVNGYSSPASVCWQLRRLAESAEHTVGWNLTAGQAMTRSKKMKEREEQ